MSGQLRFRVRYASYCSPWFDYLMVSPDEMKGILEGTGWRVERVLVQWRRQLGTDARARTLVAQLLGLAPEQIENDYARGGHGKTYVELEREADRA